MPIICFLPVLLVPLKSCTPVCPADWTRHHHVTPCTARLRLGGGFYTHGLKHMYWSVGRGVCMRFPCGPLHTGTSEDALGRNVIYCTPLEYKCLQILLQSARPGRDPRVIGSNPPLGIAPNPPRLLSVLPFLESLQRKRIFWRWDLDPLSQS